MMRRYLAFTGMTVLLIGLGIGASTSMFSLVVASVLRQPSFDHSDRLVYVWKKTQQEFHEHLPFDVLQIHDQSRTLEQFAAYRLDWFLVGRAKRVGTPTRAIRGGELA